MQTINEHSKSCTCRKCCPIQPVSDPDEARRLIKALYATGGRSMINAETLEFIKKPIWRGFPQRIARGRRGPQSNKTQYDLAYERRKRLFHVLERWPKSGALGRLKKGKQTMSLVERAISEASKYLMCEPRQLNTWVKEWLKEKGLQERHRTTIYRALLKIRKTTPD